MPERQEPNPEMPTSSANRAYSHAAEQGDRRTHLVLVYIVYVGLHLESTHRRQGAQGIWGIRNKKQKVQGTGNVGRQGKVAEAGVGILVLRRCN